MDKELRKRLEEAVKTILKIIHNGELPWYHASEEKAIRCGAEYGYKEAIALAKEWLKEQMGDDIFLCNGGWLTCKEFISGFEADMNKLWEEKK